MVSGFRWCKQHDFNHRKPPNGPASSTGDPNVWRFSLVDVVISKKLPQNPSGRKLRGYMN
jgi:hypothetical protein